MKTMRTLLAALGCLCLLTNLASAQVPQLVSYQGRVAVGTANFNGSGSFKFALVNAAGTTTYWSNDGTSVNGSQPTAAVALTVTKGLYSVLLGDTSLGAAMTAIPASVWTNPDVRLRVWFDDGTNASQLLTPDQRLAPNGYLPDGSVSSTALASGAVTSAKLASGAVGSTQLGTGLTLGGTTIGTFSGNGALLTNVNASNLATGTVADARLSANVALRAGGNTFTGNQSISTGNVGIGTAAPLCPLQIEGIQQLSGGGIPTLSIGTYTGTHMEFDNNEIQAGSANPASSHVSDLYLNYSGGNVNIGTGASAPFNFLVGSSSFGNVGIGTGLPAARLHVSGGDILLENGHGLFIKSSAGTAFRAVSVDAGNIIHIGSGGALGATANQINFDLNVPGNVMTLTSTGAIGIGTTTPTQAKLVVNGSISNAQNSGEYFDFIATSLSAIVVGTHLNYSIFATHRIAAESFDAVSDARIKLIEGRSDAVRDLNTLLQIEVTDYKMKDRVAFGQCPIKKVIAQQVEQVYPQAVSQHTDVVPDIYEKAAVADGWVKLATNLKVGERVRLLGSKPNEEGIHEVLEVSKDGFRTTFQPAGDKVFVYGREVADFRAVDYEAIAMLNVSATQEIKKEKDAEVKALRNENATLRATLATIEARLARLEQLPAAQKASLTIVNAQTK